MQWVRANRGFLAFLMLLGLFRTAVADWNPVPSGSMHPNILEGDVVLVNRLAYNVKVPLTDYVVAPTADPQRGDVVTFASPKDGVRLIKRILAIPGDRVAMRHKQLIINDSPARYRPEEPHSDAMAVDAPWTAQRYREQVGTSEHAIQWLDGVVAYDNFETITVPQGQYLMLGDNRDNSADSRYIGLVPRHLLIGKAERVLLSVDILSSWQPRWERFGMPLL
jgi:signal peptidase I